MREDDAVIDRSLMNQHDAVYDVKGPMDDKVICRHHQ